MKKIAWLDLETSGLDPIKNGIVQAAFIIDIEGEVVAEREFFLNPTGKELSPEALEVHGITAETIATYHPAIAVKAEIARFLSAFVDKFNRADKLTIGGYNVGFDISFLEQLWADSGDKYFYSFFDHFPVDPFKIQPFLEWAGLSAPPEKRNLSALATHYGLDLEDAHDAMADIRTTRALALKMCEAIKGERA